MSSNAEAVADRPWAAAQHAQYFLEFLRDVRLVGNATPHLHMVATASAGDERAVAWVTGYGATYTYAGAELFAMASPSLCDKRRLAAWLYAYWAHIPLRRERRAVRSPDRLATCAVGLYTWLCDQRARGFCWGDYAGAWADLTTKVPYIGRYMAIRILELLRIRFELPHLVMPDLRAAGGRYPRQALALLRPDAAAVLLGGDGRRTVAQVEAVATEVRDWATVAVAGQPCTYYELQALSCEYKQSALGRRQYPGRSVDSELRYWRQAYASGTPGTVDATRFWAVRTQLYPAWALGEVNGWDDARADCGRVLADYGYTWSDSRYNYEATRQAGCWAVPVVWPLLRPPGIASRQPPSASHVEGPEPCA